MEPIMRIILMLVMMTLPISAAHADSLPVIEKHLRAGTFAAGEQALTLHLTWRPKDDRARFGLGAMQFFNSINRLGQSLYEYGAQDDMPGMPFVRLPVPKNPNPSPITYAAFRRVLEQIHRDLEKAEATLAAITDDAVTLPLKLATIRFDFNSDGSADDTILSVLKALMRTDFQFLKTNPDFEVHFDRGDVSWMRGYCHLLMGMLDFYLAADLEDAFDEQANKYFAKPLRFKSDPANVDAWTPIAMKEPARFGAFRKHLVMVCKLNRETWRYIRAETDNDFEWLPHAKQKSVIGLPVTDARIDDWIETLNEIEDMLEGRAVIENALLRFVWPSIEGGLNVKTLLDDPPAQFKWEEINKHGPHAKYLDKAAKEIKFDRLFRLFQMFGDPMSLAYAAWFN
jgi:hypothetical protein